LLFAVTGCPALLRAKDRAPAAGQSPVRRNPGTARLAADKLFGLLMTGIRTVDTKLLEATQRLNEFLDEL
jgi:hypothetical protein